MFSFAEAKDASPLADVVLLGNSFQAWKIHCDVMGAAKDHLPCQTMDIYSLYTVMIHDRLRMLVPFKIGVIRLGFIGRGFRFLFPGEDKN